jgi:hypothetical protein
LTNDLPDSLFVPSNCSQQVKEVDKSIETRLENGEYKELVRVLKEAGFAYFGEHGREWDAFPTKTRC